MSTLAFPGSIGWKTARLPWVAGTVGAVVLIAVLWLGRGWISPPPAAISGPFYRVAPADLVVKVSKDGELAAVQAIEIRCRVEGRSIIQTIIPEGSSVEKGDTLLVLDSSEIQQKIDDAMLEVQNAEAGFTLAQEALEIQRSTNDANFQSAEVELLLAQLDLEQYTKGTHPQALGDARRAVEMAKITVANAEKDLEQTLTLFGKGFVTGSDVEQAKLDVLTAKNELEKVTTELFVLETYTHQKELADKKNILAQAEAALRRVQKENASNLSQKVADLQAKEQTLQLRRRKLEDLQAQLAACTVVAPADGLVVYGTTGSRWNNNPIQEGAEVRDKQVLLRLPDTREMKAVVRIAEAHVHQLQVGQRARVTISGIDEPVWATLANIAVLADSGSRWLNPDLKEYPVELILDKTPRGLKPGKGMSAEIYVDSLNDVLTVPLPALFSTGQDRYVFVKQGDDVQPRKVVIGQSNETHAEIKDGLASGAEVLMLQSGQGRELLERAGIPLNTATRNPIRTDDPNAQAPAAEPAEPATKAEPVTPVEPSVAVEPAASIR